MWHVGIPMPYYIHVLCSSATNTTSHLYGKGKRSSTAQPLSKQTPVFPSAHSTVNAHLKLVVIQFDSSFLPSAPFDLNTHFFFFEGTVHSSLRKCRLTSPYQTSGSSTAQLPSFSVLYVCFHAVLDDMELLTYPYQVAAYGISRALFHLYLHPLSRFPGPRLAAVSNLWYAYHW